VNFYPNDQSTSTQATWSYNKTNYSGTNAQAFNGATGDFQTRPFNIAASFWPARYRHGSKKDEEPTTGGNNLFVGVTQESKTRPDGMAIGSALFFEFFFAMVITLTVLRKAGNAANGLAYGMTFMLTRNVTGGWCNPAIAIGAAASFSARGFSVRGSVEDEKFDDQFKSENAGAGSEREGWDTAGEANKRWPSGNGYLWIPFLVPFVGALVGNFAAFGMGIAEIGFLKKGGAEEPAV